MKTIDGYVDQLRERYDIKEPSTPSTGATDDATTSPPKAADQAEPAATKVETGAPTNPPPPTPAAVDAAPTGPSLATSSGADASIRPTRLVAPLVVGGSAAVLLITGIVMYGVTASAYNSTVPSCTPRCEPSTLSPIATDAAASYVLFGVGAAAAAVDVALWIVFAVKGSRRPAAVSIIPGFGTLSVRGGW